MGGPSRITPVTRSMDDLVIEVPLPSLLSLIPDSSPFVYYVWEEGEDPVCRKEIEGSLSKKKLNPHPYPGIVHSWTRQEHIERIAYLVANPADDPLDLDIGVFSLNASLYDGHHRLAAAQFREDPLIRVSLSGNLDLAEEFFNVSIP